jgi:hypothetical protein
MNKNTKIARKKAIKYLSNKNGYSYSVASHIISCMTIRNRKKLMDKFKNCNNEIKKGN